MLKLRVLALLFVVGILTLTLPAPIQGNGLASALISGNSSGASRGEVDANGVPVSVHSVVTSVSSSTSPTGSPLTQIKSKAASEIFSSGPSVAAVPALVTTTKAPGGLLSEVEAAFGAVAKAAFSSDSKPSSTPTTKSSIAGADLLAANKSDSHDANEPLHKFCEYMKPICDSIDLIQPKQLFRLQSQFKQFVELTNGKLALCFLQHYSFDPALKPVTKSELSLICSSKKANSKTTSSYKEFQSCALTNWDPLVDKELDKIAAARLNCTKNHNHPLSDPSAAIGLSYDDDEFAMLSHVVNNALNGDKKGSSDDVKVVDFDGKSKNHQHQPTMLNLTLSRSQEKSRLMPSNAPAANNSNANLLNEPNTLVVFVDDDRSNKTSTTKFKTTITTTSTKSTGLLDLTKLSATSKSSAGSLELSVKPSLSHATTPSPTKPSGEVNSFVQKLLGGGSSSTTSAKPTVPASGSIPKSANILISLTTTTTSSPESKEAKSSKAPIVETTTIKVTSTTMAPVGLSKSKVRGITTVPAGNSKPSAKPLETLEQVLKRQEKEKQELETKLKLERENVLKQLQKKQDEIDAQSAIKALQVQRQSSSSHNTASDQRLHQLEHQRQMAIDPIGHTIKHQQYEMDKQQKSVQGKE